MYQTLTKDTGETYVIKPEAVRNRMMLHTIHKKLPSGAITLRHRVDSLEAAEAVYYILLEEGYKPTESR